jgi:hypothetical protein
MKRDQTKKRKKSIDPDRRGLSASTKFFQNFAQRIPEKNDERK